MQLSVGIGLVGCGTVGTAVARRLLAQRQDIEAGAGVRYELRAIAVRSPERIRSTIPRELFIADARSLAADSAVDVLVECAGGTGDIAEIVEGALERGAHVVTANKDLIATQGPRLQAISAACGGTLSYEAAVCAAIPIVRVLSHSLAGDEIRCIAGIVNGTTNAILCAMENGSDYAQALADAQLRGYAEADPSSDVDGHDAAHKLALLAQLGFRCNVVSQQITRRGISHITTRDIARARALGRRIRLIAAAKKTQRGICAQVAPLLVPEDHPFAQTCGAQNALRIVARDAGTLLLCGEGAGGASTASAVVGDVMTALRAIGERRSPSRGVLINASAIAVEPFSSLEDFADTFDERSLPIGNCGTIGA